MLDDGRVVELADPARRTPHAGPCRTSLANSVFYGIAAATNGLVPATEPQLASIVRPCVALFRYHGWSRDREDTARAHLVGHDEEAIWTPAYTSRRELWGRLGRKVDPTGQRKDGQPIIGFGEVIHRILDKIIVEGDQSDAEVGKFTGNVDHRLGLSLALALTMRIEQSRLATQREHGAQVTRALVNAEASRGSTRVLVAAGAAPLRMDST